MCLQQLRPYQDKGVEHLLLQPFGKPHSLLGDEPGTGKTIMAIAAAKKAGCRNGLIIGPAVIKEQWKRQMLKWGLCAEDEVRTVYGTKIDLPREPWLVLNYDIARTPHIKKQLMQRQFHCLILDEAHKVKTHSSQQTKSIIGKNGIAEVCYWKWALSGSIMPNRPVELYPLLKSLAPETIKPYDNYQDYLRRFCGGEEACGKGATNIEELTERIQPFMLRRSLRDVWRDCPPVIENEVWIDVPYQEHPEWLTTELLFESTERRIVSESKVPHAVAYITDRLESGVGKIVVFAFHRKVIEGLATGMAAFNPVKIYGGISAKQRAESLTRFMQDPHCKLFLAQISSAGEGLDGLQEVSSELVFVDAEWSPGREDQAVQRILRLGQTRPVVITKLLAINSYEERIYDANLRKRKVIEVVLKPNGGTYYMPIEQSLETIAKFVEVITPIIEKGAPIAIQIIEELAKRHAAQPQAVQSPLPAPAPVMAPAPAVTLDATAPPVTTPTAAPPLPVIPAAGQSIPRPVLEKAVVDKLMPMGPAGMQKLQSLLSAFGIAKLGDLPETHFESFLQHVNAA